MFWAADFWAPGFWADDFWAGLNASSIPLMFYTRDN